MSASQSLLSHSREGKVGETHAAHEMVDSGTNVRQNNIIQDSQDVSYVQQTPPVGIMMTLIPDLK